MSNANLNIKLPAAAERLIQAGHVRGLGFEYDNASARAYALMLRFGMVYDALEQEVEGLFTGEHFAELQAALETDGNTTPWLNGYVATRLEVLEDTGGSIEELPGDALLRRLTDLSAAQMAVLEEIIARRYVRDQQTTKP